MAQCNDTIEPLVANGGIIMIVSCLFKYIELENVDLNPLDYKLDLN